MIFDITDQRQSEQELRESLRELAIVEDRQRIARDLHDGVTGSLVGLGAILRALSAAADDPGRVRDSLATSVEQINSMIDDIRDYMRQLRYPVQRLRTANPQVRAVRSREPAIVRHVRTYCGELARPLYSAGL